MIKHLLPAIMLTVLMTALTGLAYPLAMTPRRALFRVPAALILSARPESSRRRFNRVSYWPFISRLFHGALSHLNFICRNRHILGTVPDPSNGLKASTAIDSRS
jgi:hypothetical protein